MRGILWAKTVIITLSLSACISNERRLEGNTETTIIELEEFFDNKQKVPLSSVASEVKYVMLKENEGSLLGSLISPEFQVKVLEESLFITDDKKLLRFDFEGNLLNEYGSQGRGPGEFIGVKDFSVCEEEETVMILCTGTLRVLKYKLDGSYMGEFKVEFAPFWISLYKDKIIFINNKGLRQYNDFYALTITDWDGNITNRLIYRQDEHEVFENERIPVMSGHNLYFADSLIFYWEFLYDSIWIFNELFELEAKKVFNIGKERLYPVITERKLHILRDFSIRRISYFLEADDYLFLETINNGLLNRILYDKKNNYGKSLFYKTDNDQELYFSFANDMDGLIPFWPQGIGTGNRLYRIFHAHEIETHLKNTEIDLSGNTFAEGLIDRINSDNNYRYNLGIMIVTLK